METREESWFPHLLSFILPIVVIAGLYQGGWWAASGLVWALGVGPILEFVTPDRAPTRKENLSTTPWNTILLMHSIATIAALVMLMWRTSLDGFVLTTLLGALSVGSVSGISGIINAHEQGHRRKGSVIWRMGRLNLLWVLYLHFTTEHNHGHHRTFATMEDPVFAPKGRGLWIQIISSIHTQVISAWKTHSDRGKKGIRNPIFHGLLIQIALLAAITLLLSVTHLYIFLIQASFAIVLLEFVNYLQHYGLLREVDEKATMMHSWESRNVWSRWTLLELPLHPAHHLKASDPMWELRAYEGSPQLPTGYYGCFWLAVFPPIWKAVMDRRLP